MHTPDSRDTHGVAPGPTVHINARSAVDHRRPFGAHLTMSWWKPVVLVVALPLVLVVLQVLAFQLVGLAEGSDDPLSTEFTPSKSLAANLAIGATGVVAVLLLGWMTGAPWRVLLSPRRAFDGRRLARYALAAAVLVGAATGLVAIVDPGSTGWTGFAFTGTTVALLVVTVLTTPIQAAGEELIYRGVVLPAAASWVRPVLPALIVGLAVSALGFTAVHGSTDPWLAGYFTVFAVSMGLIAIISGGLEAPIAVHVVNNVLAGVVNHLLSDGEPGPIDRATDTGGPSLLILVAANIGMVAFVWVRERRSDVGA